MKFEKMCELENVLYDIWDEYLTVAEIAVNNYIPGFCDGVVFFGP